MKKNALLKSKEISMRATLGIIFHLSGTGFLIAAGEKGLREHLEKGDIFLKNKPLFLNNLQTGTSRPPRPRPPQIGRQIAIPYACPSSTAGV
jgi:hypothetical protein